MAAHSHDHPEHLAHHFDSSAQQFEAGKLGMWMFLATEVLLFGGLFCGYAIWRYNHPEMFKYGSQFLDTTMGAINTAVLIASSLTMAAAVTMAQKSKQGPLAILLVLTLAGAVTFMVIKYFEYTHKFHEGWYPGMKFYEKPSEHSHTFVTEGGIVVDPSITFAEELAELPPPEPVTPPADAPVSEPSTVAPARVGPAGVNMDALASAEHADEHHGDDHHIIHPLQDVQRPTNAHMFFNIYFMMTGLHGIHVMFGIGMLLWLLVGALRGRFNAEYFTPVDLGGLYWHIVDLIWIFLFPLFYLI